MNRKDAQLLRVLVTGANGFVGRSLTRTLAQGGFAVRQTIRSPLAAAELTGDVVIVGDICRETEWQNALEGVEVVIHLAARVHVLHETVADPLAAFRVVNRDGTKRLAEQAAAAGVKRIVFVSSIKVNGEKTSPGRPFTEADPVDPQGPYAISKWEAEQYLLQLHSQGAIETVIIRSPLVYGPQVGANFLRLVRLMDSGVPLPLGYTRNKRSLVAVGNLCDFLMLCVTHPSASGETFLVCDGEDLSTTALVQNIGQHLGKMPPLFPVPYQVANVPAALLGRNELVSRLWGWLQIDMQKARQMLGWSPPISVDEGIRQTVVWYRKNYAAHRAG